MQRRAWTAKPVANTTTPELGGTSAVQAPPAKVAVPGGENMLL